MNNQDLDKIIKDVGTFQAEYLKVAAETKPLGCSLPELISAPPPLPPLDLPDIPKVCAPLFVEHPIIPEPFAIPENCPSGVNFVPKTVNIYGSIGATEPSGAIVVGANKTLEDLCSYELNIPDVVIPCFPTGPQFYGAANITIIDLNKTENTITNTRFELKQDEAAVCRWIMDGNLTVTIPKIPCPNGITFGSGNMMITSTCARVLDIKQATIKQNEFSPCLYDIQMPDIKIPCYPDGPNVHGGLEINITDRGTTVSTHTAEITATKNKCCDFELGGIIDIEIPCIEGPQFKSRDITIVQPPLYDKDGEVIPTTYPAVTKYIKPIHIDNICDIGIEIPEIEIPCVPDGIQFKGDIKFKMSKTTANTYVPVKIKNGVTTNKIDLTNEGPARSKEKACTWDITDTIVEIPTPPCPDGFDWSSNIVIRPNMTRPPFERVTWASNTTTYDENGQPIADPEDENNWPDGPGKAPGTLVPVFLPWHSLRLARKKKTGNCGAALVGEINLNLPNFVWDCKGLTVGKINAMEITYDPTAPPTQNIALNSTACGFEFAAPTLNLPVLMCPDPYKIDTDIKVYVGSSTTPLSSTDVQLTLEPYYKERPHCGTKLKGFLRIPGSGGGGFSYRKWRRGLQGGGTVGLVYPEGSRALFNALSDSVPATAIPGSASGEEHWEGVAAFGDKVFPPFKVIKCSEFPEGEEPSKMMVKIVPRSYLYKSLGDKALTTINGLNYPFVLEPNQLVYLELIVDGTDPYGKPKLVHANICKGFGWDSTVGTVEDVKSEQYKIISKTDAQVLLGSTYAKDSADKVIGLTAEAKTTIETDITRILTGISTVSDPRPRQIKAYVLIAHASAETEAEYASPVVDDVTLYKEGGETGYVYPINQFLKNHLVISTKNINNVPLTLTEEAVGSNPNLTKLPKPTLTTTYLGEVVGGLKYTMVKFETPDATHPDGKTYRMGTKSTDLQIFFTTDGSVPTINTGENKQAFKYMSGTMIDSTTGKPKPDAINPISGEAITDGMIFAINDLSAGIGWMSIAPGFQRSEAGYKSFEEIMT